MTGPVGCPACGAPNAPGDSYCGACGVALQPSTVPPTLCWDCGTPNPAGRAYCGRCGQHLSGPPAGAPVAARRSGPGRGLLVALLVVAVALLGLVSGLLLLRLSDDDGSPLAGRASPSPTSELLDTSAPGDQPTVTFPADGAPAATPRPKATLPPVPDLGAPRQFACFETRSLEGPPGTKWRLDRVHFRTSRGYDRVVYELTRTGTEGDGIAPIAQARPSIPGEGSYVGAPPFDPEADTRLDVLVVNGVRDRTRLDRYQPNGMRIVEALSTGPYRSHVNYSDPADDPYTAHLGTYSAVDVRGEGCLALRVIGWDGDGEDTAWVFLDIERP